MDGDKTVDDSSPGSLDSVHGNHLKSRCVLLVYSSLSLSGNGDQSHLDIPTVFVSVAG